MTYDKNHEIPWSGSRSEVGLRRAVSQLWPSLLINYDSRQNMTYDNNYDLPWFGSRSEVGLGRAVFRPSPKLSSQSSYSQHRRPREKVKGQYMASIDLEKANGQKVTENDMASIDLAFKRNRTKMVKQ